MSVWKKFDVGFLEKNRNQLDLKKMFKAGAINENGTYFMLEIEKNETTVKTLAKLERGFEEYVIFDLKDYEKLPTVSAPWDAD